MASATLSATNVNSTNDDNFLTVADGAVAVKYRHLGKIIKRNLESVVSSFAILREEGIPVAEWDDYLREEFSLPTIAHKPAREATENRKAMRAQNLPLTAQLIYERAGDVITQMTKDGKKPSFSLPKIPEFGEVQVRPVAEVTQSLRERIKAKRDAKQAASAA